LGFPVAFPLQASCLPTASVKLGVSAEASKGQQARCVLRSVLRLTNGLSEAPAAPLYCAGRSSLTRPSWTSCTFSCERPKAPLWITIGSSGDHPQRGGRRTDVLRYVCRNFCGENRGKPTEHGHFLAEASPHRLTFSLLALTMGQARYLKRRRKVFHPPYDNRQRRSAAAERENDRMDMTQQKTKVAKQKVRRDCDHCRGQYVEYRATSKYCSARCRVRAFQHRQKAVTDDATAHKNVEQRSPSFDRMQDHLQPVSKLQTKPTSQPRGRLKSCESAIEGLYREKTMPTRHHPKLQNPRKPGRKQMAKERCCGLENIPLTTTRT